MDLMVIIQYVLGNGGDIIGALSLLISALIAISLLIPGEQPEKALQVVLGIIKRFSRK